MSQEFNQKWVFLNVARQKHQKRICYTDFPIQSKKELQEKELWKHIYNHTALSKKNN